MAKPTLAQARRTKMAWIVLVITVIAFVAALAIRELTDDASPILKATYQSLGGIAGLGTAFVFVILPLHTWQERKRLQKSRLPHE